MLAFDYNPDAHYFSQRPLLCRTSRPFANDFGALFGDFSCGSNARRSFRIQRPHRHHHRHIHDQIHHPYHPHHRQSTSRSIPPSELLSLLHDNGCIEATPAIYSEVLETQDSYQVIFKKSNGSADFCSYLIRYVTDGCYTNIIIESKEDNYKKVYCFAKSAINIESVQWRIAENVLVINIPKAGAVARIPSVSTEFVMETDKCAKNPTESENAEYSPKSKTTEKNEVEDEHRTNEAVETQSSQDKREETPRERIIPIPIEYVDSSEDVILRVTPSKESPSECLPSPSFTSRSENSETTVSKGAINEKQKNDKEASQKLTPENSQESLKESILSGDSKLTKKVILEDLEDEAFLVNDLD